MIALSPLSKDRINKHYNIDLDGLYTGSRTSGAAGPSGKANHSVTDGQQSSLSLSWPSPTSSATIPKLAQGSVSNGAASVLPPYLTRNAPEPPLLPTRTLTSSQTIPFTNLESASAESSLPMPTTLAPGLPLPPPVPSRNNTLQIKRAATPTSDLLDLRDGKGVPEVGLLVAVIDY